MRSPTAAGVVDADHSHDVLLLLRTWLAREQPDDVLAEMHRLGINDAGRAGETLVAAIGILAGLTALHAVDTERSVGAALDDLHLLVMADSDPELL